ncbi:hypothetical protein N8135_02300 [Oceanospirillaceae bacterium]|jgi:hypothetical protein|nr:hypothetical protein [Oceanospirillaceae bacterium]|tara:strand:- start:606 stop:758 length:153 start_codon:yes stop_codon:yes gene_type:complete
METNEMTQCPDIKNDKKSTSIVFSLASEACHLLTRIVYGLLLKIQSGEKV